MASGNLDKELLEFFQAATRIQGVDESIGTIMGVLYLEPEEISMEELARKTSYSLSSISNKVRMFEPTGMIKRIKKPHTKKVFFTVEKDVSKMLKSFLLMKQESVIQMAKERLPCIISKYKAKKLNKEESQKIAIMEHYYDDMIKFEMLIKEILARIENLEKKK
jgi:DNA-binding transcriptional regulator GbsR (MarR family)